MIKKKDIINYYDQCESHYRSHWNLDESLAIHYGYWDESTKNFPQALQKINEVLAQKAQIKATDRVLDAGCGIGGSSIYLAQNIGCQAFGITLSEKQVASARRIAATRNVTNLTRFEVADFTDTSLQSESFEVVWGMESVCHAPEKMDFLKEAYRLLKPKGRLIVADFFKADKDFSDSETTMLNEWAKGWAVPDFEKLTDFSQKMKAAGFKNIQIQNITDNIRPSARRLYYRFFVGWVYAKLYNLLFKTDSLTMDNVWTAYWQYRTLDANLWQYYTVSAEK